MKKLPVLYLDEHLMAVNKPAGLLVHRSYLDRHETEYAMQIARDQLGRWVYPLHRLDKGTSGVLIFALDRDIARAMTQAFTEKEVSKSYIAVVRGYTKDADRIDYPLKERCDRLADGDAGADKPAREAVTVYQRLATIDLPHPVGRYATARYSLVKAMPHTGRMHQIRRHMKHVFHPVIGDTTYGDGKQNEFFRNQLHCSRMLLHAADIAFPHPAGSGLIHIHAPFDPAFTGLLQTFDWETMYE